MKKAGIVIFVIGLLLTIFTAFKFVTKEKVVDIGELEITRDKNHSLAWSPLIGVAVMVIGGGFYLLGAKKQ
ncbi:MAG: hypothetical protein U1C46_11640 [Bacteroidales bacterium]|nr:hypothetical protein [Bacteroidales bacterium]